MIDIPTRCAFRMLVKLELVLGTDLGLTWDRSGIDLGHLGLVTIDVSEFLKRPLSIFVKRAFF